MTAFQVKVNGQVHAVDVLPDTPLLWVIRDSVGLTGTKFGCGVAMCGACTVFLNGKPLRSCALIECKQMKLIRTATMNLRMANSLLGMPTERLIVRRD